jgi:hypothetical protein
MCAHYLVEHVAHSIVIIVFLTGLLVDTWAGALPFNPVMAGSFKLSVVHGPHSVHICIRDCMEGDGRREGLTLCTATQRSRDCG